MDLQLPISRLRTTLIALKVALREERSLRKRRKVQQHQQRRIDNNHHHRHHRHRRHRQRNIDDGDNNNNNGMDSQDEDDDEDDDDDNDNVDGRDNDDDNDDDDDDALAEHDFSDDDDDDDGSTDDDDGNNNNIHNNNNNNRTLKARSMIAMQHALEESAIDLAKITMKSLIRATKERTITTNNNGCWNNNNNNNSRNSRRKQKKDSNSMMSKDCTETADVAASTKQQQQQQLLLLSPALKQIMDLPWKQRHGLIKDLREIFDEMIITRRYETYGFYSLWRELIYELLTFDDFVHNDIDHPDVVVDETAVDRCGSTPITTSTSTTTATSASESVRRRRRPEVVLSPVQLFGWELLEEIIYASALHRPPPRAYHIRGAGCDFVNGMYEYAGKETDDGYGYVGDYFDVVDGHYSNNFHQHRHHHHYYPNGRSLLLEDDMDTTGTNYGGPSKFMYKRTCQVEVPLIDITNEEEDEEDVEGPNNNDDDDGNNNNNNDSDADDNDDGIDNNNNNNNADNESYDGTVNNDGDGQDDTANNFSTNSSSNNNNNEASSSTTNNNNKTVTVTKTLTLFQCVMQSKQKWWFLSEADEEQPGTDRDIDYYEQRQGYNGGGGGSYRSNSSRRQRRRRLSRFLRRQQQQQQQQQVRRREQLLHHSQQQHDSASSVVTASASTGRDTTQSSHGDDTNTVGTADAVVPNSHNTRRRDRSSIDTDYNYYDDNTPLGPYLPPSYGWKTSKDGIGPPPTHVTPIGVMVPDGEESNTLEHQLARWMLQKDIVPMALRQSQYHTVIANHYLPLVLRFGAASMFELDLSKSEGTGVVDMTNDDHDDMEADVFLEVPPQRITKRVDNTTSTTTNDANTGTQFILELAQWYLDERRRDATTKAEGTTTAAPNDVRHNNNNNNEYDENNIIVEDQRVVNIAKWLRMDVLDGPNTPYNEVVSYGKVLVWLGLDSVESVLSDLRPQDVQTMPEIVSTMKVFHRRRLIDTLRKATTTTSTTMTEEQSL